MPFHTVPPLAAGGHVPRTPLAALLASIRAAYLLFINSFSSFSLPQMIDRRRGNADTYILVLMLMMLIQGCATARDQRIQTRLLCSTYIHPAVAAAVCLGVRLSGLNLLTE